MSRLQSRLAMVAATLVLPLLYFHRATFSSDVFIARDILLVYYPLKQYWAERVSQGEFPAWYPYNGLGQPFAGMLISGVFHPTNVLYLLLPLGVALKLIALGSYVAALGGTYRFAREWGLERKPALLAGITYALGGYLVGISNNLLYLMAAATFPWALWGAERFLRQPCVRRAAAAALFLCLVLLSGEPQSFALCCALVLVLALVRPERAPLPRAASRAVLLIVLAALLAAVQIAPVLSLRGEARPTAPSLDLATYFSFHPLRMLEFVLGPIFLNPETDTVASFRLADEVFHSGVHSFWVNSVHVGAPALLLAGAALWAHRRRALAWAVAAMALLVLALSMGRHLPLYGWLYQWMPVWNSFRFPEKLLPYFMFACALGAGAGLEAVLREPALSRRVGQAAFGLASLCGLFALAEWRGRVFSSGVLGALWERPQPDIQDMLHGNVLLASVVAGGALGVMGAVLLRGRAPATVAWAVVSLQLVILYLANGDVYLVTIPEFLEHPSQMVATILEAEQDSGAGRPRVYGAAPELQEHEPIEGIDPIDIQTVNTLDSLWADTPALWRLESAKPYLPVVSWRAMSLLGIQQEPLGLPPSRILELFHVKYVTVGAGAYRRLKGKPDVIFAEIPRFDELLLRNSQALPRAYLATPVCVPDQDAARNLLFSRSFTPGQQVALECPPGPEHVETPTSAGALGQVRFVRYAPEEVVLEVEATQPAALVLNDAYYSGWSATVDGRPASILPANVAVRGVRLTAGTHQVTFSFRAPGQRLGATLTLVTLGLLGLALLLEWRQRAGGRASPTVPR
ncbi:YfhO family protein [Cystobacter fuscus]|uniref:YfhO family protein n=1 Tax=Cystobacter fuscus TaxID=43 RepID=UPI002B310029|nr:YfhO family protein [Cystobacter fuscus]